MFGFDILAVTWIGLLVLSLTLDAVAYWAARLFNTISVHCFNSFCFVVWEFTVMQKFRVKGGKPQLFTAAKPTYYDIFDARM